VEVQHPVEARLCPRFKLEPIYRFILARGNFSQVMRSISANPAYLPCSLLKCRWVKLWTWVSSYLWVR
jgi:hypothetical protein